MSKKDKNIENLFKQKFESYQETPPTFVWNTIEQKIPRINLIQTIFSRFNIVLSSFIIVGVIAYFSIEENIKIGEENTTQTEIAQAENNETQTLPELQNIKNKENTSSDEKIENSTNVRNQSIKHVENIILENETKPEKRQNNIISQTKIEQNPNKQAKAFFTTEKDHFCVPATVKFENISTGTQSYLWNFGDGTTSQEANPVHTFSEAGKYHVKLTAQNDDTEFTFIKIIEIAPKPHVEIEIENRTEALVNENLKFILKSNIEGKATWNFGDGNESESLNPVHRYKKKGIYDVSLIYTSENGCIDNAYLSDITILDSKYRIKAPTAFTPDFSAEISGYFAPNDRSNNVFHPIFTENPVEYKFRIYNSSGIPVFESTDPNFGWNGRYNRKPQPDGVYIWECTGKYTDGKTFYDYGNVTLVTR